MAQFRSAESALLKKVSSGDTGARGTYKALLRGIIGCSGAQPDAELADGSAMALASTSPQYPEYDPFLDLRNTMIQEALESVKASPPSPKECADSFAVSRQLGIPDAALAVYG
ncbi:hypothetical protein OEZ86_014691 [Tetradesmus obliquus]|uniref:Uncharacterized protein n=1 Tax=Tetradesmus obliquus TaxID=3088 RepID=A0ABY8U833_TETOB|nr:hypothetical protein OEZ85_014431 [Tetradesmus obliquus]WIA37835.1 hypothetical protein OEZ86_014691 [Tetradesmus obliquus]